VPIGACLARAAAAQVFKPGSHGSTFGGNPLAARAALAVIETLASGNYAQRAAALGTRILDGLTHALRGAPGVRDIRGRGLMLAIELDAPCKDIMQLALTERLLVNVTAENVVRLLPPLVLSDTEADTLVERLVRAVRAFLGAS